MVKSKKLLSLFLAVVMVFSVLTVMASAYTVGPEVAGDINYKYTVEKVASVPETAAGSAEWSADNIYAVTAWMKCDDPVVNMTIPFHFNKALFSPIMLSDGECTYPYGAGFGVDDYYSNMGEGAIYAYSLGDYMNNTGMYKADGSNATSKALAKCIGLGNSNSAGIDIIAELVSPDHPLYSKWGAGLPENTGVMYASLDVAGGTKTAYFNTIEGIETNKDWNRMFTVYFEAIADDVSGAEFGVYTDDCFTVDGVTDLAGYGYFVNATTTIVGNPNKNVVSNDVVEAAPSNPIYHVKNQIQWANAEKDTVNLGVVAGFDVEDIAIEFYNGEDGGKAGQSKNVDKVGAVVTINGVTATNFEKYVYSANDGASYYFRAVIAGIPADYAGEDIVVTPLVWMTGEEEPMYGEAITITADKLATYVEKIS